MPTSSTASRQRYIEYQKRLRRGELGSRDGGRKKLARRRTFRHLFKLFWDLLRGQRVTFFVALTTLTMATMVSLTLPVSTKIALDYILADNPGPTGLPEWLPRDSRIQLLWMLAGAMIVVTVVTISLGMWGRWQTTRLTKRLQVKLRRSVYEHAVRLPMHRVHELKSGGVASVLREDAGGAAELLFSMMYNPWRAVVQLSATLAILSFVDWRLLVGALMLLPLIWMTHRAWISRLRPVYRDIRQTRTSIDGHVTEAFGGMRVVRGFGREQGEAARFVRETDYMVRQEILAWWWSRGVEISWQILIPVASAALLVYGGSRIVGQTMTLGDLMMFSAYLLMLLGPLEALAASATRIQSNLAGFDRILDLLDEPREFADSTGHVQVDRAASRGGIEIESVWFAYPRRVASTGAIGADETRNVPADEIEDADRGEPRWVLEDISLTIEPGQTIAIVGPSGAGKTTLCSLIARLYDPQRGTIRLDGVDLCDIDIASFRSLLGIVEQDVFLFDGTVAQNIAYGRRGCTREQVVDAARAANAHRFITDLEDGYDTLIGERGVLLSGGQKQRVAIARALLADPTILILDEATSNLDTESEALIQQSLARLMRGRTSFVIAHRLSTVRHADRIVVIEEGRILETGSHDELLARDGRYAEFLRMQLGTREEMDAALERAGVSADSD
ncbi:MAG: ABC transporter ATP-binding protein [Planctomycetes bacterium]|nr:ABC transporter ATP-binding protein [Planctomycetota bacterium]